MPGLQDIPGEHVLECDFAGHATAGTAIEQTVGIAPFRCTITSVKFVPNTSITGAATNYFTLNVRNRTTAGAGTAVPAALAFDSGTDATALVPKTITLSGTAADLVCAAGDVITVQKAVAATGLACPPGKVIVTVKAS